MPTAAIYARKSTESEDRQILSIDSQIRELRDFARREGIVVSNVFTESKSAKAPGRPVFGQLLQLITKGLIDSIVCWKVDRLARNPVDGGSLIWAMEEKKLNNIYSPGRTFINSGNDKFFLGLEFGIAKKYVDDLSDNVKRGIRAKLELGWMPGIPPLGYLNDRNSHTVVPDPDRFKIVRRMWEMMLTGNYSPAEILQQATSKWGLRSRQFKRGGGNPVAFSAVYSMFHNPFYYGMIVHRGTLYPGKHKPMVTKSEFVQVGRLLSSLSNKRPIEHTFAYTGLIRCGECGAAITAEHKNNRYGNRYIYYHCTKRKRHIKCSQRSVELKDLERQIVAFLDSLTISPAMKDWSIKRLQELCEEDREKEDASISSLNRRLEACRRELRELVNLRLRGLLTDDEFTQKKIELEDERNNLQESMGGGKVRSNEVMKRSVEVFNFAESARRVFQNGSESERRAILRFTGSNLSLKDKILNIEAQIPLQSIQNALTGPRSKIPRFEPHKRAVITDSNCCSGPVITAWQTLVEDVRTFFLEHPQSTSIEAFS